ncbi:MAG: leucine-rich repeat domain-containing protein [Candidatus Heimdallarchaeota archaeon]|nr:leucine-rich repeat domain-containing protein [Candidatus Heimdallarchaeota archaeon]
MPGKYLPEAMRKVYFEVMEKAFLPRQNLPPMDFDPDELKDGRVRDEDNWILANAMLEPYIPPPHYAEEYWEDPSIERVIPPDGYELNLSILNSDDIFDPRQLSAQGLNPKSMTPFQRFTSVDLRITALLINLTHMNRIEYEHVRYFPYLRDLTIIDESKVPFSFGDNVWSSTINFRSLSIRALSGIRSSLDTLNDSKSLFSLSIHRSLLTPVQISELDMPNLVILSLVENKLNRLPSELFDHTNLKAIDLTNNPLVIEPSQLISFQELRFLSLEGCNLSREILIDLSLDLPHIVGMSDHNGRPFHFDDYHSNSPDYIDRSDLR